MYELEEVLPPVLVDLGMRMTQVETRLGQKYEHNIEMTLKASPKIGTVKSRIINLKFLEK